MTRIDRDKRTKLARSMAAAWLREVMKGQGITMADLSSRSGVSRETLGKILSGRTAELRTLERIAIAVDAQLPTTLASIAYKRHNWRGLHKLNGKFTSEYKAFANMHQRVSVPTHRAYPKYGGSGIKIHVGWANTPDGFENFLRDMGPRPSGKHSLHRTPATADYGPMTCVWADKRTQSLEQRGKLVVEYNSKLMGRADFEKIGIEDGFLCVVKRNADGSPKKSRRRKMSAE